MEIEFSDGRIDAVADGEGAAQPAAPKPKSRPRAGGDKPGGQGTLL